MAARLKDNPSDDAATASAARKLRRSLGQWLKERREAKGLTQADLGLALGIKYYSFISQVENGIGRIPQELYGPWADSIGVAREEFAWMAISRLEPGLFEMLEHLSKRS